MWKLKKELILEIIESAKNVYPNEFICFLGGDAKKEIITEFVFIPNESDRQSASVYEHSIPFDNTIVGTVHSHPNSTNNPSNADKKMFAKYKINIILGYPFSLNQIGAYNEKTSKIYFELI